MTIRPTIGYGFDDLLLEPRRSNLKSHNDVDFSAQLGGLYLPVPIVSSPMDTVTEWEMARFMAQHGGIGIIHRYMPIGQQAAQVWSLNQSDNVGGLVGGSTGTNGDALDRARALIEVGADAICIDVAHGHTATALNHIEGVRKLSDLVTIISGNVATPGAVRDVIHAGADVVRVGIGAGSACTTRIVAGVGIPQITAVEGARAVTEDERAGWVLADGGIKNSGDVVKAFAAGADAVMLGGLLAKYSVSPRQGEYRGMASRGALMDYKGEAPAPEGETFSFIPMVEEHQDDEDFAKLVDSVKQGFAYLGAANARELRDNALWTQVSALGYHEGESHFQ